MTLFTPQSGLNRVFALPPGIDFAQALVDGLALRMGDAPPEDWARLTIWVNTRRTARRIETLLQARGPGLLPQLRVLGDLAHAPGANLPPAPDALRRHLTLATLVAAYQAQRGQTSSPSTIFDLAQSLADLLDELEGEGQSPELLDSIESSTLPRHWVDNLQFLGILKHYLASLPSPYSGGEGRRRTLVAQLAEHWQANPPHDPVLVVGSTGSRRTTRDFMAAVAHLPQGAIILPAYDASLGDDISRALGPDHPQYALQATLAALNVAPNDMQVWHDAAPANPARGALVSLALRPAPVTDHWLRDGPALAPSLGAACADLTLIEADSPRHEALSIALALRRAVDLGQTAALVTPDRVLARRVSTTLRRWGINADDSAGQPLHLTPPGLLLRLLADADGAELSPVALLDILKNPLIGGEGVARGLHLGHVRTLENTCLRGGAPRQTAAELLAWAAKDIDHLAWLTPFVAQIFTPYPASLTLAAWAYSLLDRATALGPNQVWKKDAGEAAQKLLTRLADTGPDTSPQPPRIWAALMLAQMQQVEVRAPSFLPHPGIAIWGPLEARVQSADLLVLGGLTEGSWPRRLPDDHWLSRGMRAQINLPLPELRIGLAGHDFQTALGAPRVVLSRALRNGEAETLPSRWLLRLTNLLQGLGDEGKAAIDGMRQRGQFLCDLAKQLDRPVTQLDPAPRPNPVPPLDPRPKRLSVTGIESLIRDPYAIYARDILRLRPLKPLGREPNALEQGTALHAILADLVPRLPNPVPPQLDAAMLARIDTQLTELAPWPAARAMLRARLMGAMAWFLSSEADRRTFGQPHAFECSGAMTIPLPDSTFEVSAKADRIDRAPDGQLALYDYKSGSTMAQKAVDHHAIQLPIEALIAAAGGFKDVVAGDVAQFAYLMIGGKRAVSPGKEFALGDTLYADLQAFLSAYRDPTRGYAARLRHDLQAFDGDYDHLARFGEWDDATEPKPQDVP